MQYRSQWLLKFLSTGRRKLFFHMTGSSKRPVNSTRILTWNGSAQEKECWAYLFSDESRTMSKDRCCRFKRHRFTDLFEQVEQQKMFSAVKLYSRYFLRNGMSLFFKKKNVHSLLGLCILLNKEKRVEFQDFITRLGRTAKAHVPRTSSARTQ